MLMLTKFELKDIFIPILTTKGLISNFKKHNDETRITLKLKDFLRIFHYLFNTLRSNRDRQKIKYFIEVLVYICLLTIDILLNFYN